MCTVVFFAVSGALDRRHNRAVLSNTRPGGDCSAFAESILSLGGILTVANIVVQRRFMLQGQGLPCIEHIDGTAQNAVHAVSYAFVGDI